MKTITINLLYFIFECIIFLGNVLYYILFLNVLYYLIHYDKRAT